MEALETLRITARSEATEAVTGLEALATTLERLRASLSGFETGAKSVRTVAAAARTMSKAAPGVETFATGMNRVKTAISSLDASAQSVRNLANAGKTLSKIKFAEISSAMSRVKTNMNGMFVSGRLMNSSLATTAIRVWAVYRVLRLIATALAKIIELSNNYIEMLNLFNVAMGQYASKSYEYANKVSEALGIDPAQWMEQQAALMEIIGGYGVASDKAAIMSQQLTQLGYDLASLWNTDVATAFTKIQSGITGQTRAVRSWGFDISAVTLAQTAERLGLEKSYDSMTQAEKAYLRYYVLMTQITNMHGDMARTIEAPANQLRVLKAQLTQAGRAIGNLFIPILNKVLPYIIATAKAVRLLAEQIANLLGIELPSVSWDTYTALSSVDDEFAETTDTISGTTSAAQKLKKTLLGIDEINMLSDSTSSGGSGSGSGGAGSSGDIWDAIELPTYDFLADAVETKIDGIIEKMKEFLGLSEPITSFFEFMTTNLGTIAGLLGAITAANIGANIIKLLSGLGIITLGEGGLTGINFIGILSAIAGEFEFIWGLVEQVTNEATWKTFLEMFGGGALAIGGSAMASSSPLAALFAAAIDGIAMFSAGLYDAATNGQNLINALEVLVGGTTGGAGVGGLIGFFTAEADAAIAGAEAGGGWGAVIGLIIGALANLSVYIAQNWPEISAQLETVSGDIRDFTSDLSDSFDFGGTVSNGISWMFESTRWFADNLPSWIGTIFDFEFGNVDQFPETLREIGTSISESIDSWVESVFTPLREYDFTQLGEDVGSAIGNVIVFITNDIPNQMKTVWDAYISEMSTFVKTDVPNFFAKTIPEIWQEIEPYVEEFPGVLFGFLDALWQDFWDIGASIFNWIGEGWSTSLESLSEFGTGFFRGLWSSFEGTKFYEIGNNVASSIKQGIDDTGIPSWIKTNIITPVTGFFSSLQFSLPESIQAAVDKIKEFLRPLEKGITNPFTTAYETIKEVWNELPKWFSDLWNNFLKVLGLDKMFSFGKQMAQDLKDGLNSIEMPKFHVTWEEKSTSFTNALGSLQWLKLKVPKLSFYAQGGMPDSGELYMARENGISEMVGRIGRNAAVANNDQIVTAVSQGVASANETEAALLREQNRILTALLEKDSTTVISTNDIVNGMNRLNKRAGKTIVATGV